MTPEEAKALWDQVAARRTAMDGCGAHAFVDITPDRKFGKRWRCSACGGEVDTTGRTLYDQGVAHGRRSGARP